MNSPNFSWWLIEIIKGGQSRPWPLKQGVNTIGRGVLNSIDLKDDKLVSRQHAEIEIKADGQVEVRELKTKNGLKVNTLYRQTATLQSGDKIEIGSTILQLTNLPPSGGTPPPKPLPPSKPPTVGGMTIAHDPSNDDTARSDSKTARLLLLCSILIEGVEAEGSLLRCLKLLREAFSAQEVQYYHGGRRKTESNAGLVDEVVFASEEPPPGSGVKRSKGDPSPCLRVASFLATRFRSYPEATIELGKDIGRHQTGFQHYNYLIGPLAWSQAERDNSPFLVIIKPDSAPDFTTEDKGRLQLICQVWRRVQANADQVRALKGEKAQLKAELKQKAGVPDLIGESEPMKALRSRALKAAANPSSPILLLGENGSGKEVVAHFVQQNSPGSQSNKPFVIVNIAAIPEGMIESDLFGHSGGAFTGAIDRRGKFFLAHGGTLMLDEIGELPMGLQSKLLRTIEYGEIQPLGSEKTEKVEVRIIAATNRDLRQLVAEGKFRQDLFFRLNVLQLRVPPLRERKEDIPLLAQHLLNRFSPEGTFQFTPAAIEVLHQHSWPGNVRELYSVVQSCVTFGTAPHLTDTDVREALASLGGL